MSRYEIAKSLFVQAVELAEPERAAFVARATAGDSELRRELEELLAFHEDTQGEGASLFAPPEEAPARIGPWRIDGELGRGGIGVVYLASRDGEPPVALKLLKGGLLSPHLVARFRREASVLARLDHPGIARAIETGIDEGPNGPRPWLAMERIVGVDLRNWAGGGHSETARLELMARVCDAVQHAHDHGVVHRDLKPENILVRPDGSPVVLDFGVARLVDSDVRATTLLTTVGVLIGTIRYMSPEQADASPEGIGPRSDVHQLAALTYELLTGRLPFDVPQNSVHRALVAVLTAPPRPMEELPAKLRRPLEQVLRAALAKNPGLRLASASLLAADLRRVATGRAPIARPAREGGPDWARLARGTAGAAAVAVALAWLGGAVGQPPSPLDRANGALRPARMYRRVMAEADSALVRLHYNTRTLPRLREARTHAERALALLETVANQPWYAQVRSYLRFRLGEAQYLLAERTYDAGLYAQAAATWYTARELPPDAPRLARPDTLGIAANASLTALGGSPWGAAAMAFDDLARLADPLDSHRRALAIRREAIARFVPGASPDSLPPPPAMRDLQFARERAGWLQGFGASRSNVGFMRGDTAEVRAGVRWLRQAAAVPWVWSDGSGYASILHDLGTAFLRLSALTGDPAPLDSAFARLQAARAIRAELPGYTSVVFSNREFARAHRLAAWRTGKPAQARAHLLAAYAALTGATPDVERGAGDAGMLAVGEAEVLVDLACVERDTSRLVLAARELDRAERALPRERAPVLAVQADLQRVRIEGQWLAITGSTVHRERARQLLDRLGMNARGLTPRDRVLAGGAARAFDADVPRRFALGYPISIPF